MDISIIIVNYNTSAHLDKCLSSIYTFTKNITFEIIVVDNNSPNREIKNLSCKYSDTKFIFREVNDGFGAGCNYGAKMATGKYLAFINPDTVFSNNVLNELVEKLKCDNKLGVCSPMFIDSNGDIAFTFNYFPDIYWEMCEFFGRGYERRINKLLSRKEIIEKSQKPCLVDWVTGACIVIKNEVFQKVNGFDDNFFLYYEDVDLQYRIRKLGYEIAILPNRFVFHSINSSTKSVEGENVYIYNMYRSKIIYYNKTSNFLYKSFIKIFHIIGLLFRIIFLYVRKRYSDKRKQKMKQYIDVLKLYIFSIDKYQISDKKIIDKIE
jgi:GT2 family glycosyltransferase